MLKSSVGSLAPPPPPLEPLSGVSVLASSLLIWSKPISVRCNSLAFSVAFLADEPVASIAFTLLYKPCAPAFDCAKFLPNSIEMKAAILPVRTARAFIIALIAGKTAS